VKSIEATTYDLSVRNPDGREEIAHRSPEAIIDEIVALF
jgi:type I restriction enzyme M protein